MIIQEIETIRINPAAYNPRVDLQPEDPEYEKLKRSIQEFGYIDPLIWNKRTGNLVGGHQRFKVLMETAPEKLTVSIVDLDDHKEKALNIALNKIEGDWEENQLAGLLEELKGNTLALTGFDDKEIDDLLKSFVDLPSDTRFDNAELSLSDYDESKFDCKCPKCGYLFNRGDFDA